MLETKALAPILFKGQTQLRILATTDLHMWMLGYDYYLDQPNTRQSLSRLAPMIARRRSEAPNSLLFDNGDLLQGTPMADVLASDWKRGLNHENPVMQTLTQLGYDGATLGNHDFNFGLPYLDAALKSAGFPVICANALKTRGATPADDVPYFPPYDLLYRELEMPDGTTESIQIGVIGFLPPQIVDWDHAHLSGKIETRGIVETARHYVPALKAAGADIIVALCHSGIGNGSDENTSENAGLALSKVEGIDALVLGHIHHVFPEPKCGPGRGPHDIEHSPFAIPTVMPGFWGSHLGIIDLTLSRENDGWSVENTQAWNDCAECFVDNLDVADSLVDTHMHRAHARTLDLVRRHVGSTPCRLYSYFGALGASPVQGLIARAKRHGTNKLIKEGQLPDLPVLCMTSPFKSGGQGGPNYYTDIPAGQLAMRHVADLYLFPNRFAVLRRTGRQVLDILHRTASRFSNVPDGAVDYPLFADDTPHYQLDWIEGLSYAYDLSQPEGHTRVRDVRIAGRELDPDEDILLATNNYRIAVEFPRVSTEDILFHGDRSMRDVLIDYLHTDPEGSPFDHAPMRLTPFPTETTCVFTTGPGAADLIDAHPRMERVGIDQAGFLIVRLTL